MNKEELKQKLESKKFNDTAIEFLTNAINDVEELYGEYISEETILERIKQNLNCDIEFMDDSENRTVGEYFSDLKSIKLKKRTPEEEHQTFLHEFLHCISTHKMPNGKVFIGFKNNRVEAGINEAMTQYLTEQKYPESNKSYQEIKNILQKILEIIPREEMIKSYLYGEPEIEELIEKYGMNSWKLIYNFDILLKTFRKESILERINFKNLDVIAAKQEIILEYVKGYCNSKKIEEIDIEELMDNVNELERIIECEVNEKSDFDYMQYINQIIAQKLQKGIDEEKLKQLRENIDIITMSATPIPRTLYMSLSGIKDMSIINTPPKNRLPIKTYVGEWNENMVKNAIIHELDREGQVFYLYNRVETIDEFRMQLQKLVPNARIAIGHGQMDEKTLEKVIIDFANHEYDILLATTIIENGIDIPNANTMIIHNADKFGLAQLYQLRGRVGRSQRQAYCYCFYTKSKEITQDAVQRLKAIKEFTTLGSGYQIAMRDVEIRGVGNILGTKQHGHMVNVGFDTYCQLLEETVQELQGQIVDKSNPTIVDINVTAFIPDEWVGSAEQKMIEYKRLADVKSDIELDYITEEWKDRFAKPPESVENLIKLIKIRLAATDVKISLIRETEDNIRIYTPYSQAEWKIIQRSLPSEILKRIKFFRDKYFLCIHI